ncbi:hypothetical protein [Alteribacter aurantiacus]|uniref:hypothetical protein n=1 Tax=Alteribacter aurantiacus TaxID=254410 RepID=UPI0006848834|nr:hypothetical protein [Alteribacter aurantiacus]
MKRKMIIIILSTIVLVLALTRIDFSIQNNNPIPYYLAVSKKVFTQEEMVIVWKNPNIYLVDFNNLDPFIEIMIDDGWEYVGTRDRGAMLFEKGNVTQGVSFSSFAKKYTLINSPLYAD